MGQPSKRTREIAKSFDFTKKLNLTEAVDILKKSLPTKFDQSVDISLKMGVDPRKPDQLVRGTVSLPNGTGKHIRILVFAEADKLQEAKDAGATYVGNDELLEKVSGGWTDFDAVISTPSMMRNVGKLGKVLGPRGLMPTPKAGTVTTDVATAIKELKGGKIEFKLDKHAVLNNAVGKLSFAADKLIENILAYINAVLRAKPASARGTFLQSLVLSSTMGPGIKIDLREILAEK
jgi:large subunit ribosomal protein L1